MEPRSVVVIDTWIPVVCCLRTALIVAGETWATPVKAVLEPVLNLGSLAFLIRIVLSWYPQVGQGCAHLWQSWLEVWAHHCVCDRWT